MLKQTKDYSHYSYEQISELVKHNKKLAQIIENLFLSNMDIYVWENNWDWDIEFGEFAEENLDYKHDQYYEGDGWEIYNLETQYEKLLQHTEGVDEDGNPFEFVSGEGDEFNWDEVELKDGRYVVVIDRDDYISINLLNPKKLINGKLEMWSLNYMD
jgi:hypothetical protein